MKLLLDTHALLWSLDDDARLGPRARDLITDRSNDVLVSIASIWEIAVKIRIGKLEADTGEIPGGIERQGFRLLAIEPRHLIALRDLPSHRDHRDPFDQPLIAKAISIGAPFVSEDRHAPHYPIDVLRCADLAPSGS